ncbi:unnamed protein product [Miscanthus lutarioriparius]|uniref:BED-type domain-containing protein n=1 Tax=Miscanthus lutarioriparius TaxID=422564 RepID=A0A811MCY6_9POAL|nr:unnamed protein product [Miscanthus lutarioriparius]
MRRPVPANSCSFLISANDPARNPLSRPGGTPPIAIVAVHLLSRLGAEENPSALRDRFRSVLLQGYPVHPWGLFLRCVSTGDARKRTKSSSMWIAIFPRIHVKDPYQRLGISREASEEEIRAARNYLISKYAGHKLSVDAIESAHDRIIMQKGQKWMASILLWVWFFLCFLVPWHLLDGICNSSYTPRSKKLGMDSSETPTSVDTYSNRNSTPTQEAAVEVKTRKKYDPAWGYCTQFTEGGKKKIKCMFCNDVFAGGGIHHFKEHLAKYPGNVAACKKIDSEVEHAMFQSIEDWNEKKKKAQQDYEEENAYGPEPGEQDDVEVSDANAHVAPSNVFLLCTLTNKGKRPATSLLKRWQVLQA